MIYERLVFTSRNWAASAHLETVVDRLIADRLDVLERCLFLRDPGLTSRLGESDEVRTELLPTFQRLRTSTLDILPRQMGESHNLPHRDERDVAKKELHPQLRPPEILHPDLLLLFHKSFNAKEA